MPELTVSILAYNTGKYIREAIESVFRQDGIDFESPTISVRLVDYYLCKRCPASYSVPV